VTDWVIEPLRKIVPPIGMIDITPIVAWFAIQLLLSGIMRVL
jgi:YggT family protein